VRERVDRVRELVRKECSGLARDLLARPIAPLHQLAGRRADHLRPERLHQLRFDTSVAFRHDHEQRYPLTAAIIAREIPVSRRSARRWSRPSESPFAPPRILEASIDAHAELSRFSAGAARIFAKLES